MLARSCALVDRVKPIARTLSVSACGGGDDETSDDECTDTKSAIYS
eukprot:COSAG02_NODE_4326_length_5498_cov_2.417299_6_plen_46_part_00